METDCLSRTYITASWGNVISIEHTTRTILVGFCLVLPFRGRFFLLSLNSIFNFPFYFLVFVTSLFSCLFLGGGEGGGRGGGVS